MPSSYRVRKAVLTMVGFPNDEGRTVTVAFLEWDDIAEGHAVELPGAVVERIDKARSDLIGKARQRAARQGAATRAAKREKNGAGPELGADPEFADLDDRGS